MWIARSTSPPGGAGPSATSCGSMPRAWVSAGARSKATRTMSRRNIVTALVGDGRLVEVRPKPALGLFERDSTPSGIILELIAANAGDAEILAVAVPEIEAGHSGSRQHREILG